MSTVDEMRPPITTMASGWEMNPPCPVIPSAIGVRAKIVASAVMRIGRRRREPPATTASCADSPFSRYWFTRSTSTIAFVTTMPMSMRTPMSEATPSGTPVAICSRIAPVAANGTETSRSRGWRSDLNVATITMYTMRIAASIARPSWPKASCCCVSTPPTFASAPVGRSTSFSTAVTVAEAAVRLSVDGVTVTVDVRCPRCVVMEVGPWLSATVATWSRVRGPAAVGICSAFSSSIVAGTEAACR